MPFFFIFFTDDRDAGMDVNERPFIQHWSKPGRTTWTTQAVPLYHHQICHESWREPAVSACKIWCHYQERFKACVTDLFMTFIIEGKKFMPLRMTLSAAPICWKRHSYLPSTQPEKVPLMASSKQNSDLAEICVLSSADECVLVAAAGKNIDSFLKRYSNISAGWCNASSVRVTSVKSDSKHFRLFILFGIMLWLQHIKSSLQWTRPGHT